MPARPPAALVLEHEADAPVGLLGDWALARGIALEVIGTDGSLPDLGGRPFVVSLGSEASAFDDAVPWLAAERAVLDRALRAGVPILGICFGAQHLARALGGVVAPAARPEVGWLDVETLVPEVVPPGPWLQWHRDAFTLPPGAELLARSLVCVQAFRRGRHLGVQFHPEVTPAIAEGWAHDYPESMARASTDLATVCAGGKAHAADARLRAFALFDAFLASARSTPRMPAEVLG
ncbi:type 1 glutamine amidotransferase [Baekduia sp.]|jgi:GMP synthase-like glutamine amidotransferase|uniref:type 1 glutamine amidotransferase n=1 Tax=Baekduia sp. TaxID=2600305 RepID=UPI002DFD1FFE|nr:type 1 glutamine amidotransferase [Baekduia sp.]